MSIGFWDIVLVLGVSLHCVVIAYLRSPFAKAAVLTLPIPFTLACLAVAKPIGASNAIGIPQALLFIWVVYVLHNRWRVPIIVAIVAAIIVTSVCACVLAQVIPSTNVLFWLAIAANVIGAALLYRFTECRREPPHRTPLPIWLKLPAIIVIVSGIVTAKQLLQGFATVFPMVTIITCYEARHSLWTLLRRMMVFMMTFSVMEVIIYLAQPYMSLPAALGLGWVGFFVGGAILDLLLPGIFWLRTRSLPIAADTLPLVSEPAIETSGDKDAPRCDMSSAEPAPPAPSRR